MTAEDSALDTCSRSRTTETGPYPQHDLYEHDKESSNPATIAMDGKVIYIAATRNTAATDGLHRQHVRPGGVGLQLERARRGVPSLTRRTQDHSDRHGQPAVRFYDDDARPVSSQLGTRADVS